MPALIIKTKEEKSEEKKRGSNWKERASLKIEQNLQIRGNIKIVKNLLFLQTQM